MDSEDYSNSSAVILTRALFYLFLLALGVRLIFVALYQFTPDDAIGYDTLARNIMNGQGFSLQAGPPFEPTLYHTPVYPYFLVGLYSVFGFHAIAVYLSQAIIGSLTCCLMYFVARAYVVPRTAFFVVLVNAIYPFTAYFTATKLTETLFTFLLCVTIYLIVQGYREEDWRWMCAGGLMLGVAILCRPENLFFPFFLAVLFLLFHRFRKPWWKLSATLVIASMVVLTPWMVRNYRVTGKITPLVRIGPGTAFWQTTLPYFDWNTFQYAPGSDLKDPLVWQLTHNTTMTEAQVAELEPQMWRAGIANIRSDPKAYVVRRLKEYPHLWISSGDYLLGRYNHSFGEARAQRKYFLIGLKLVLLAGLGVLPLALAILGLFGLRSWLIDLLPLWAFPLYVTLGRFAFDIAPRNTLPAHPYMLFFAVCGAIYLWRLVRRDRSEYQL